ncbi:MAG: hypothetical protein JEZ05_08715 [Tenericutes bacterium]|nr:hypothetical protein [Mycoplasmatota bacterium]
MYSSKNIKRLMIVLVASIFGLLSFTVFGSVGSTYDVDILPVQDNLLDETYLSSNQFTQIDDLSVVNNFLDVPATYLQVGESDSYILYMEEESFAIRVLNKVDGFIYGSSISTLDDNLSNFNTTWEGIVNSCVTIKYYSYNKKTGIYTTVEESFLNNPESVASYELIDEGFEANLTFGESDISLTLRVYLDDDYLVVEVPNDSIQEGDTYKLRSLKTYPFLGAVYGNSIPGYIFVPDGSGALIRYQEIDVNKDIYEFRYFGQDNSIQNTLDREPVLAFPVSGMVLGINQHGFISIVEDGAEFASLNVFPAKRNLKYYYTYNEFVYRSLYQTPLSESEAESGSGRLVIQENTNSCNVVLKYMFLDGMDANYVGMANNYQDYLVDNNLVVDNVDDSSFVSIFLDVIGSETKKGFIFDEYLEMTTLSELQVILEELNNQSIKSKVVYKGFTSDGFTSSGLWAGSVSNRLGTKSELNSLINFTENNNIDLYFYFDPMMVYEDASFNLYKDIARRINQNLYQETGFTKDQYYITPERVVEVLGDSINKLIEGNMENFAIGSLGNTLYSDYNDKDNPIDRSEAIDIYQTKLADINQNILMYQNNLYLLRYSDSYLMMPMTSSRYRIYTDTVPFSSYVLSGLLDTYSPYQNFSSSSKVELLKMVDYGVYPSYILTNETAYALQNTELRQIYSSSYNTWKTKIKNDYEFIYKALNSIINAKVISRSYEDIGVYKISYSNGVDIYVNYTNDQITYPGFIIEPLSYKVVE